jgi:hypothetical protein
MALPEKRNELNQVDEQTTLNRLDEEHGSRVNQERIEERYAAEDQRYRAHRDENQHAGHDFGMDLHPERYPREALSRLEEGILEDDEKRHFDDHLGYGEPAIEHRVEDIRSLSRTLLVLGSFLLIFAWVLLLWVGWDVRSGSVFFSSMCAISVVIGLGLIVWGIVERQRVLQLHTQLRARTASEQGETIRRDRELREGDRAA